MAANIFHFNKLISMNQFLSPKPLFLEVGIAIARIVIGIFLIMHGKEVFDAAKIQEYANWEMFKGNSLMPYLGKAAELAAGILLVLGLFTRFAALITIGTFLYIVFFIGHGKFWSDDQHPFLFALFGLIFFFTGPGCLALDNLVFKKK